MTEFSVQLFDGYVQRTKIEGYTNAQAALNESDDVSNHTAVEFR